MATGGIALLLAPETQPHAFDGLRTIGKVVYIIDLVIFLSFCSAISYRFIRWRGTFIDSLTHPTESLFVSTLFLSMASIIAAIARYAIPSCGPWLVVVYRILFWIYFAVTFCWAVGAYTLLYTSPALRIQDMTPAWDLPIFPFMLCGTIAASGSEHQPPYQAVPMIVGGLTAQGLGFVMSILMYASYIRRMIQYGFPGAPARPAMFIAVGPPSFTALALIGMANDWPRAYMNYFGFNIDYTINGLNSENQQLVAIQILRVLATMTAVFTWSLSAWFFCIAAVACFLAAREMTFHLNWWAFIFPNVGFIISTISIGKIFQSEAILYLGNVLTILIICLWFFVAFSHVWAVWHRKILWAGKDEDTYRMTGQTKKEKLEKQGRSKEAADIEKQD